MECIGMLEKGHMTLFYGDSWKKSWFLYLIKPFRDFGETPGNQQLEHLKGALFNSQVTSQV